MKLQIDDLTEDQLLWVLANRCSLEHSIIQEIRFFVSEYLDSDEVEVPDELLQGEQA